MGPVLKNCRETLTGQVSLIMKLLEMQVKYGLNVVNAEDEVTGKFDPEKVCDLQQQIDKALGTKYPELSEGGVLD